LVFGEVLGERRFWVFSIVVDFLRPVTRKDSQRPRQGLGHEMMMTEDRRVESRVAFDWGLWGKGGAAQTD